MPELPEVQTIVTDLEKHLENSTVKDVTILGTYTVFPNNKTFVSQITNRKILRVFRLAKNIILELNNEEFVQVHLAMTGRLLMRSPKFKKDTHERVIFSIKLKNGKDIELRFCDTRMFGKVRLLNSLEFKELIKKYGPEPIDNNLSPEEFYKIVISKKTIIKNLLMDQNKLAGLGNAYAIDALWIASIHPETSTQTITPKQAETLLEACREILWEGIKNRGLTIDSYVDAFGKAGKQQDFFRVYRQEKCQRCNSEIEFKKINGRGTFFCPICQIKDKQGRLI